MTTAKFRADNTEGFTNSELAAMNEAYLQLLADYEEDDTATDEVRKSLADAVSDAAAAIGRITVGSIVARIREGEH